MNNIQIANETLRILKNGCYQAGEKTVKLGSTDYSAVEVISPADGEKLLNEDISGCFSEKMCEIEVTAESSFAAAARLRQPMVMSFANAHKAGGGFRLGAKAQEEALCRCSTLYASITSQQSKEMYRYNNTHISAVESDYMLFSPDVLVFRDDSGALMAEPFTVSVITLPAPNLYGAAMLASKETVSNTLLRRIRIMLRIAVKNCCKELVLGAWGCGAFGNDPNLVASHFSTALVEDGLGKCFNKVVFAIYGKPDGKNITAFKNVFH